MQTPVVATIDEAQQTKQLKERSQLHRMIARNCWLFGQEFSLSVDDQSLTQVLIEHKKMLDPKIVIDEPVKHVSQTRGIVDLMLSTARISTALASYRIWWLN